MKLYLLTALIFSPLALHAEPRDLYTGEAPLQQSTLAGSNLLDDQSELLTPQGVRSGEDEQAFEPEHAAAPLLIDQTEGELGRPTETSPTITEPGQIILP
jgi:hypothetical protein